VSLALRGVDPYLQEAMGWLTQVIESWGGGVSFYSGRRTRADQQELWDFCNARRRLPSKLPQVQCPFPVATPGCSQHEYGFAVDAGFFSPRNRLGISDNWNVYAQDLARVYWGLSTVADDPNHFQQYPSSEFLPWVRETGQCRTIPRLSLTRDPFPANTQTFVACGPQAVGSICNHLSGCECFY